MGLLVEAIQNQARIVVLGDFDADGATSTALMIRALGAFGHAHVDYVVPNRFDYGYGLSVEIIEVLADKQPDVLVTVDNGISSLAGVEAAKARGWTVIITDHHLPGETLPQADAIVNPNQPGCKFPSKHLAGVGVVFYLMGALRAALKAAGWFESQALALPRMSSFLDLVALGTVADVVPLDENNRLMIHAGLKRIRAGQTSQGIRALCEVAKRGLNFLTAQDLAFALGPRLNAAGRLEDMSAGIECLLTEDPFRARTIAIALNELNQTRRAIESKMNGDAQQTLTQLSEQAELPLGLVLFEPDWHQGVVGILASRVKERFNRPVIAFARTGQGELKGSGRSIAGVHLRDLLARVDVAHPELILKFGGHAMAAGLSVREVDLNTFSAAFNEALAQQVSADMLTACIYTDGALEGQDLNLDLALMLQDAGPWGQAFEEPVFDGYFNVVHKKVLGNRHLKMAVAPRGQNRPVVDLIAFNLNEQQVAHDWDKIRLAYTLGVNRYRGDRRLQLIAQYMEPAS